MFGGIKSIKPNGNKTIIIATSMFRKESVELEVNMNPSDFLDAFHKWDNGALIQDAFPTLNSHEREFILSGITKKEWEEIHKE